MGKCILSSVGEADRPVLNSGPFNESSDGQMQTVFMVPGYSGYMSGHSGHIPEVSELSIGCPNICPEYPNINSEYLGCRSDVRTYVRSVRTYTRSIRVIPGVSGLPCWVIWQDICFQYCWVIWQDIFKLHLKKFSKTCLGNEWKEPRSQHSATAVILPTLNHNAHVHTHTLITRTT